MTQTQAPPAPGWGTVVTTWAPGASGWAIIAVVVVLTAAYLVGAARPPDGPWPWSRTAASLAALVALVLTVGTGVSADAPRYFAVHMVMHLMLIMVVPALWIAGRPLELLRAHLGPRAGAAVDRWFAGRVARAVTFPATVLVVYALVVVLTHLTGFASAVAVSPGLHVLEQLIYLATGLLFFHTAVGVDLHPRRPAYFVRFVLMLISMGVDTLVGIVLMMAPTDLLPVYRLDEVHLAGAIMWAVGDGLMMVIMVVLSWSWVSDSSARVDFGPWLESARRAAFADQVAEDGGHRSDDGDLDDDDEALAAYNRMLARLNRGERT